MAPLLRLLLLALPIRAALNDQITWGSVVFTYHGEKTPILSSNGDKLSPLGAQQMLLAGQSIRNRYVVPNTNQSSASARIVNLSTNSIDNTQLKVASTNIEYVSAGATAFMGGLYPPRDEIIIDDQTNLSNGTLMQYPWDNWQFANIGTLSLLDYNYIWIAGNEDCTLYDTATMQALNSDAYEAETSRLSAFYDSLKPGNHTVFEQLNPALVHYYNAYPLYEYALYQYNHNVTIFESLAADDLAQLQFYASQQQFQLNTPTSIGTLPAISGATLASRVLQQLRRVIDSSGRSTKMFLYFGSYEPFLAFFALSNLSVGPAASRFTSLPQHGSLMSFELFSIATDDSQTPPFPTSTDDLWVRFFFRNGTDDDEILTSYPLFGRGNSETDMKWSDFAKGISDFGLLQVGDWCLSCQTSNIFCAAAIDNQAGNSTSAPVTKSKKTLNPAVAGVIGAIVALVALGLVIGLLALLGFRMQKREKRAGDAGGLGVLKRTGSGKGFKGAEKLPSDTDLRLKGGAGASVIRHERVGSWELHDSPNGKHSSLDKEIEAGAPGWRRGSEDGIGNVNPFGDPVKAADQV